MSIATANLTTDLRDEVIDNLHKLHQANVDSAEGFQEAAENITDKDLAKEFLCNANERRQQADELANVLTSNGDTVNREQSWLAKLHQCYLSMRASVSSNDTKAVLSEAERGEDHIKEAYEDVLKDTPGSAVNDILQRQYLSVKATHDRIRDLRDNCC